MRLFIYSEDFDPTTDKVIDYLWFADASTIIKRFNYDKGFHSINIGIQDNVLDYNLISLGNSSIQTSTYDAFWFRRGHIFYNNPFRKEDIHDALVKKHLDEEWRAIQSFLTGVFDCPVSLGDFHADTQGRKINDLILAKKAGLLIPDTIVTTQKKELERFFNRHLKIITKPLNYNINLQAKNFYFASTGVKLVAQADIDHLDEIFFPVYAQSYVEKALEIRIFFIEEKLFPMAIFSQNDEKTAVDFRNYNQNKPNRNVPFSLPDAVEEKIKTFIRFSGLDTGSIDLILNRSGEYYFLEVNPCGQFSWLSINCNYNIEKEISSYFYLKHERPSRSQPA